MAKVRKKKASAEEAITAVEQDQSEVLTDSKLESERKTSSARKNRTPDGQVRQSGAMAPFAVVISVVVLAAVLFSLFYRPMSSVLVAPDVSKDLRIRLSITTQEFATEGSSAGSLNVCEGTKTFPGISQAKVIVNDSKDQPVVVIPVKKATSKLNTTCYYELVTNDYKKFTGSKLKVSVQFPFGTSNIFTVDVGEQPPYGRIDVKLTLS